MNPDPVVAWNVVLVSLIICNLVIAITSMSRVNKIQKREVNIVDGIVTKENCSTQHRVVDRRIGNLESEMQGVRLQIKNDITELRREIHSELQTIEKAGSERANLLHRRVDDILAALCRLEGSVAGASSKS